jgi:hypothetical protein
MLLRPTFSSAMKERDHEPKVNDTDELVMAQAAEHAVKTAPMRRNSLLLNPTASSRLKEVNLETIL